jgi:hypothetical protein
MAQRSAKKPIRWVSQRWFGILTIVAMVGGTLALASQLLPHQVPTPRNPSALDVLFDSRAAVLAVRLVLFNGAVFLVASILVRTYRGDWIFRIGSVETPDSVEPQELAVEALGAWKERAKRAEDQIEDLTERLETTQQNYQWSSMSLRRVKKKRHA